MFYFLDYEQLLLSNKMLSYRRETALQGAFYSFGQTWKTGTGRQYFTDGLSSTTVI